MKKQEICFSEIDERLGLTQQNQIKTNDILAVDVQWKQISKDELIRQGIQADKKLKRNCSFQQIEEIDNQNANQEYALSADDLDDFNQYQQIKDGCINHEFNDCDFYNHNQCLQIQNLSNDLYLTQTKKVWKQKQFKSPKIENKLKENKNYQNKDDNLTLSNSLSISSKSSRIDTESNKSHSSIDIQDSPQFKAWCAKQRALQLKRQLSFCKQNHKNQNQSCINLKQFQTPKKQNKQYQINEKENIEYLEFSCKNKDLSYQNENEQQCKLASDKNDNLCFQSIDISQLNSIPSQQTNQQNIGKRKPIRILANFK